MVRKKRMTIDQNITKNKIILTDDFVRSQKSEARIVEIGEIADFKLSTGIENYSFLYDKKL